MTFAVPVCSSCGTAAFPPRALCPRCGSREWRTADAEGGTVEAVAAPVARVRTAAGPLVVARVQGRLAPGDAVELEADGGVPVARVRPSG